jgi:chromatin structure-remodeling complex subunit RSC9
MGLRSGLPDEVSFGLARLVEYSDKHPSLIPSPNYPGLLEMVIVKACAAKELGKKVSGTSLDDFDDSMETKELHKELELVANAMLILRNIVTDDHILTELVSDHRVQMYYEPIISILSLPSRPCFFEIKNYALETLEYTAQYLVVAQDSELLSILKRGIESDDRNELIRSLRSLGTLGSAYDSDAVNYLSLVALKYFELCIPQLMLNDTELILACLDFLYNYTSVDTNLEKALTSTQIIPLVEQCVRLLEHNTRLVEENRALYRMAKPRQINEIPAIPSEILTELISYPEPERATKWY